MKSILLMAALGGLVLAGCEPTPHRGRNRDARPGPPSITIPGQPMADLPPMEAALSQELREELRDEIHAYSEELAAVFTVIDGVVPSEE